MGSQNFLTKEEAAKRLGVHWSTVYRYVRKGLLSPVRSESGVIGVDTDDLLRLMEEREEKVTPTFQFTKQNYSLLVSEVKTLRAQMKMVMRVLNFRYEPLKLSDVELTNLYEMAKTLSIEGWPPQVEEMWSDVFMRLTEEDLRKIHKLTKDDHPWRPFYRLATTMWLHPYKKDLKEYLSAGRTNVQHLAEAWTHAHGGTPKTLDVIIRKDASPLKRLCKALEKNQPKR